jgi:predicted DNA-binding protein
MNQENEYESLRLQLEVATRALHVIAVMGNMNANHVSEIAMDALREMETYGLMYDFYDDEE